MFSSDIYNIYGTNNLDGKLGMLLYKSDEKNILNHIPIPLFGVYKYIQISSDNSDILLESIDYIYHVDVNNKKCTNICTCEPYCTCEPICKCGIVEYIDNEHIPSNLILNDNNIIENNDIINNKKDK